MEASIKASNLRRVLQALSLTASNGPASFKLEYTEEVRIKAKIFSRFCLHNLPGTLISQSQWGWQGQEESLGWSTDAGFHPGGGLVSTAAPCPWLTPATPLWGSDASFWAANWSVLFGSDHLWIPFQLDILWSSYSDHCHKALPSPPPSTPPWLSFSLMCLILAKSMWKLRGGRQGRPQTLVPARPPFLQWLPRVFRAKFKLINSAHSRPWFLDHCLWNHLRQNSCTSSCSSLLTVKVLIKVLGGS